MGYEDIHLLASYVTLGNFIALLGLMAGVWRYTMATEKRLTKLETQIQVVLQFRRVGDKIGLFKTQGD